MNLLMKSRQISLQKRKPSNGSDYELRAENVRALRDQDLSYIDHKYEEQRKQKSRPTQHPLKRPKKR